MRSYRPFVFAGLMGFGLVCAFFWHDSRGSRALPPSTAARDGIDPTIPVASTHVHGGAGLVRPRAATAAGTEVTDLLSAITPFRRWLDEVNRGQPADFREGLTLAVARRKALHTLIQRDPESALRQRIPALQRTRLPAAIAGELETLVDTFSQFEVIAVCGRDTGTVERFATVGGRRLAVHTYGARVRTVSQEKLPTHGIAIDDQLALAAEPYRLPDTEESLGALDTARQVQAYVGDAVRAFSSVDELTTWGTRQTAAELQLPSVFGERTLLFLKIDFADAPGAAFTDQVIATSMAEADRFHRVQSAERTSFKTTILPTVLRSAKLKSFYNADPSSSSPLHVEATALARQYDAANGNSGTYNPDRYQHVVVLFTSLSSFDFAGSASAPGKRVNLNGNVGAAVIAHELGHNLGLRHGHAWKPTGSSPIQPAEHVEYGDPFDVMGSAYNTTSGHFSVPKKRALNYITDENVQTIGVTGSYRLYRHDATIGTNTVALKIDAGSAYDYWLEYRRDVAPDLSGYAKGVMNGVLLHWNKVPSFTQAGAPGTYLLDMSPGSAGGMNDSALVVGQSFYDPSYKIRLTPLQTGSSAQGDWIDVAISLGDRPANRPPTLQSVGTEATAFARAAVNLTATSSDPDGDTVLYQWDMGDGIPVYTTGSKLSYQWSKGGAFPVTVRAFDIYGGETRQTFNITVRDPLDAWDRISTPGLTEHLRAVCFGLGKFVAVGAYVSAASVDGKVWSRSTSGNSIFYGTAITASASRFVAVGVNWSSSLGAFVSGIYSSVDGVTWTNASPSRNEPLNGVAYGNGRFVAVGDKGIIWSSQDGLLWSSLQLVSGKALFDVQFNGSSFLAVGDSGTALLSADGVNWQDKSLTDANTTAIGVSFFKDTGGSGLTVLNGKWTVMTSWAFLDKSARLVWSSDTGITWSIVSGTYFDFDFIPLKLTSVGQGSTALVFPLHNTQPKFRYSSDGVVWNEKVLGPALAGSLRGGAEGKGRIVLVGEKGQIFITADGPPALAQQPQPQSVNLGQPAVLQVTAYATGPFSYQWKKDGAAISGATSATLTVSNAQSTSTGNYTVTVSNSAGFVTSNVVPLTVNIPGRLINLSVLTDIVAAGDDFTLGYVVGGTNTFGAKPLVIRAAGPSLGALGVLGTLDDPKLELFAGSTFTGGNDNWGGSAQLTAALAAVGAFAYTGPFSKDAATTANITTRDNSVKVSAVGSGRGTVIAEIYDATSLASFTTSTPRLINVSVRKHLGSLLTMGFVVGGSTSAKVLVRGIGPTLGAFGVPGTVADPQLTLFNSSSVKIGENNDWGGTAPLTAAFASVGAFALPSTSKDAALLVTLAPGNYTAQVTGVNGTTGVALVEVYEVP
jgi:hypothetical protein